MTSKEQECQPQQQGGVESKIPTKDELYEMLNKMKAEMETNHKKAIGELETKIAELEKSSLKQGEDISKLKDKMHSLEKGVTVRVAGSSL
jgi:predicted  nucleic acid-binding Zn-ribbon protein